MKLAGRIGLAALAVLFLPTVAAGQPAFDTAAAANTDGGWNLNYRGMPEAPAPVRVAAVKVRYLVDKKGKPSRCEVVESSGSDKFDEKTCPAIIGRMHFEPKIENGKPVEHWRTQTVRYQIED